MVKSPRSHHVVTAKPPEGVNPPGLEVEVEEEVLVYVPPSQQNAQRPASKPGEPVIPGTVPTVSPQDVMKMVPGKLRRP